MGFIRNKEDFDCEHCGAHVIGTGYTNHCPKCLWSRHVDIEPGDRAENCGGMMEPIRIEGTTDDYTLIHRCTRCKKERRNKVAANDDKEQLILLAKQSQ